jgi:radical SAM superfamily enzyme YgiQ (UPF0313 family)
MSAEVLLTHSYHLASDAKQWRKMQPYPPLGTLYAATALQQAGISVAVFDPMFANPVDGFLDALETHRPKLVAIYEDDFNFVTKMCLGHMRELALELATIARLRGVPVVAHGSDATDHPRIYLDGGVDFVLTGEAEQALVDLCLTLRAADSQDTDTALRTIPGLISKSSNRLAPKKLSHNANWPNLPTVSRGLIDLTPYREAWKAAHGFFSTNVVASRGCPFQCNWCAKPISGNRFQLRPAQSVAAELHDLKSRFGVEHIWFSDDIFALDRRWVEAFADAVEAHGDPLPFKIQARADLLSAATVEALRRAGCTEVWMGVESGSEKVLAAMSKGLSLAAVHAARRHLADAGIRACFFLQFGYPGEGWPEVCETIDLVRQTRPDDIGVSVSYPLPGTVFHERVQQQLGAKRNWTDSDDLCNLHTAAYRDEFYHALRDALHAEVDGQPPSICDSIWARVHHLEPISRNANVVTLPPTMPAASFLSIAEVQTA